MGYRSAEDHAREQSGRYMPASGDVPNDANAYEITWADLPLNCPLPRMSLWNSHPKVYLPIHKSGREQCPYCGAIYILLPPVPGEAKPFFRGDAELEALYHKAVDEALHADGPWRKRLPQTY